MFISKTTAVVLAISCATFLAGPAYGEVLLVPSEYLTIQAAIDAAENGCEIVVAPGTYPEHINFLGKAVTVRSSDGADVTTIGAVSDCCYDSGNEGCDDPECEALICEADPACCEEWDDICATAALESCQICNGSVVTCASNEESHTVLEGFTITGGTGTDNGAGNLLGGGMYNLNSSPTVTDCIFDWNSATNGGGMYCSGGSPTISNCTFTENSVTSSASQDTGTGGAIHLLSSSPAIANCLFTRNTANAGASTWTGNGGAIYTRFSDPVIDDCKFIDNEAVAANFSSSGSGGGLFNDEGSNVILRDSTFVGNAAIVGTSSGTAIGGGIMTYHADAELTNCIFIGNRAIGGSEPEDGIVGTGSGGGYLGVGTFGGNPDNSSILTNCIFAGNSATGVGCANGGGGGLLLADDQALLTNCDIIGNSADCNGGGIWIGAGNPPLNIEVTNCTLSGNSAGNSGGGIFSTTEYGGPVSTFVDNSIVWGNTPNQIVDEPGYDSETTVTYSDVEGGWPGPGNIDADPLFVDGPSGTWTANGVYTPDEGQTTLTDAFAAWKPGALEGMFINPDTSTFPPQHLQSLIVANTATTVTVWADFSDLGTIGADYQVRNYHLTDSSPCIDAANNTAVLPELDGDLDGNPRFVDDPFTPDCQQAQGTCGDCPVVDMGSSEYQTGCIECCLGDFDCSGGVGAFDLAILLGTWGPCLEPCEPGDPAGTCAADLDGDCVVEAFDLALLLGGWGPCE